MCFVTVTQIKLEKRKRKQCLRVLVKNAALIALPSVRLKCNQFTIRYSMLPEKSVA